MKPNQISKLERDLKFLFYHITKINKVKCYDTDLSCYNLYGLILCLDFKLNYECNLYPGLPPYQAELNKINHPHHIFDGILDCILDKKFATNIKIRIKIIRE